MVKLIVRHQVANFDAWHQAYHGLAALRRRFGVVAEEVYSAVGDANDVTVAHDFETLEQAQAILASEEVMAALADAGVVGVPTAWIVSAVA